jgi:hypothetical protein
VRNSTREAGAEGRGIGRGCKEVQDHGGSGDQAYLIVIHFELSYDFDGDFISGLCVSSFVDVAEGTVAHLLDQNKSFQSGISGHLAGLFSLFSHYGFDIGLLDLLVLTGCVGCNATSLSCDISVVPDCDGVLAWLRYVLVLSIVSSDDRLTHSMVVFLRLSVHR